MNPVLPDRSPCAAYRQHPCQGHLLGLPATARSMLQQVRYTLLLTLALHAAAFARCCSGLFVIKSNLPAVSECVAPSPVSIVTAASSSHAMSLPPPPIPQAAPMAQVQELLYPMTVKMIIAEYSADSTTMLSLQNTVQTAQPCCYCRQSYR